MIRHCTGVDPNVSDAAGNRGQCGRSFDDRRYSLVCPHEELITPSAELDPSALARYTFHANGQAAVFVHCNYHAQPEQARLTAFPHWAQVRGLVDALAWIEYHEQVESHPGADATSPAAVRSMLSVVDLLARELYVSPDHLRGVLADQLVPPAGPYLRAVPFPHEVPHAPRDEGAGMADVSRETSGVDTVLMPRVVLDATDGPDSPGWFEPAQDTATPVVEAGVS